MNTVGDSQTAMPIIEEAYEVEVFGINGWERLPEMPEAAARTWIAHFLTMTSREHVRANRVVRVITEQRARVMI
jgi:hypothetical protein